jgi:glycosyltransferase involved in cell wall biosynthesis
MSSAASSTAERPADAGEPARRCAVLVPAFNEAGTIAAVVTCALQSELGVVLVVDDGSTDGTAEAASAAGARVLRLPHNLGKGGAVAAAAAAVDADVVVLLDADLIGLTPAHVLALATPVLRGETDMTRGVFRGGRWRTTAAQRLTPQLNGQRALRRDALLAVPGLAASRYGVEVAIGNHARRQGWRRLDVALGGVSQVMKEEKRGLLAGISTRAGMYRDILRALLRRRRRGV